MGAALGEEALARFSVSSETRQKSHGSMVNSMARVRSFRRASNDSYNFNWLLHVPEEMQNPFVVSHDSMRKLELHRDQPLHRLVANLRRAFSGIVSGNVKEQGIAAIEKNGPFELCGDPQIMGLLDDLLQSFVAAGRMKLPGSAYKPCYRLVS